MKEDLIAFLNEHPLFTHELDAGAEQQVRNALEQFFAQCHPCEPPKCGRFCAICRHLEFAYEKDGLYDQCVKHWSTAIIDMPLKDET